MSDCQRAKHRLVAFLVGEVSGRESAWLAEHVRLCAACQEELASLNLTVEILRRLPREDVSAEFERKLALRIAEHSAARAGDPGHTRRWPWRAAAVAAGVVLAALVPLVIHSPGPELQQAPTAHRQPGRHRATQAQTPPAPPSAHASSKPPSGAAKVHPLPSAPALAEEAVTRPTPPPVVGRVLRITGTPRVAPGEGQRAAPTRQGMTLRAGAVLTTGDTGQAEVELAGGSRVQVGFDTSVAFAAGRASRGKAQGEVRLSSGRLWLLVPRSQRGLTVRTPQARVEALGPISAVSVLAPDRLSQRGPGLHVELAGLTTATALRGRLRLASEYGSVTAEEGASAEATTAGKPSLVPGLAHLHSVRAQVPWGQTLFEVWVADRLELDEALRWVATGDDEALLPAGRLLAAGHVAEARREYESLVGARPDDAAATSNLGLARELEGDTEGALAAYGRAAELAPRSARSQHNLGMAYLRVGNLWRACEPLAAALELEPQLPGTRFELGRALSVLGDLDGAARQAQLLEVSPETAAQGACLVGDIYWLQGDLAGAESWYLKAVQEDPSYVNALTYLAGLCLLDGRVDEAQSWTDRALAVDPDSLRALNRLGLVLLAKHRPKEAEAALLRAEAAHPGSGIVLHNLGEAYLQAGDISAAVAARRQAVAAAPDSVLCHMGLAIALEASGGTEEARREYETTLRLDPTYAEAAQRLAALLERLGDPSAARLVLARVQQYLP